MNNNSNNNASKQHSAQITKVPSSQHSGSNIVTGGDLKLGGLFPLVKCHRNDKLRKIIEERRAKFLENISGNAD